MSTRARVPQKRRRKDPRQLRPKDLGNGVSVIQNGPDDEPIYVGRDPLKAHIGHRDFPANTQDVVDYLRASVLPRHKISEARYQSDTLKDGERHEIFLAVYAMFGNVRKAALAAQVDRSDVVEWRTDVDGFSKRMDEAFEDCVDQLEEEARFRAKHGREWKETTEKDVIGPDGNKVGVTERTTRSGTERSDTLLMFLLRGQRAKYATNKTELSGPDGAPIPVKEIIITVVDPAEAGQ